MYHGLTTFPGMLARDYTGHLDTSSARDSRLINMEGKLFAPLPSFGTRVTHGSESRAGKYRCRDNHDNGQASSRSVSLPQ